MRTDHIEDFNSATEAHLARTVEMIKQAEQELERLRLGKRTLEMLMSREPFANDVIYPDDGTAKVASIIAPRQQIFKQPPSRILQNNADDAA